MSQKYDTIFFNGKIYTADPENPFADCMVVKNGKVTYVGEFDGMGEHKGVQLIDLEGARVLPGFVDSHMHPIMLANSCKQISALPPAVHSIEELIEEIKKVRQTQGPDEWIQGWGYDEGKLKEGRTPTRYDLDKGAEDAPVSIVRTCGHIRCLNSKALELAGITKDTKDPVGGKIDRDENGEPTGILRESARNLVIDKMPTVDISMMIDNLVDLNQILVTQGVTTIGDMSNMEKFDAYSVYDAARKKGFKPRVGMYYGWQLYEDDKDFALTPEQTGTEDHLRISGVKLIADGSVSGRTAWCDQPYLDSDDCGMPVCTEEEITSAIAFCKKQNCQLSVHAMGAKAIEWAIDHGYDETPWTDRGPYLRIEHVAMPTERDIKRASEKGIAFVTQPIFLYAEIESYLKNMGLKRTQENYPIADWIEAGVNFCFSTDAPATAWATPSDPFACLKGAVTRLAWDGTDCGQRHKVDIRTAIDLYTAKSAPMLGFTKLGMLKPGYFADFVVLDRDILEIPADEIDKVKVVGTFIDGECVYGL